MPRTFARTAPPLVKYKQVTSAAVDLVLRLRAARSTDTVHGQPWKEGMVDHYAKRAEFLLSQAPRGCQTWAAAERRRLRAGVESSKPA